MKNHVTRQTKTKAKTKVRRRSQELKTVVKKKTIGSLRLRKGVQIMSENVGNPKATKTELMGIGYSESYIDSGRIKNTKQFQELVEKELPDELLLKKHNALITKEEVVTKNNNKSGKIDVIRTGEIDVNAVKYGLDMAYKLKKKYGESTIIHKYGGLTDEELEESIARNISRGLGAGAREDSQKGEQQS